MSELKLDKNRIRSAYLLLGQEEEKLDALANQFAISILSEGEHFRRKSSIGKILLCA